RVRRRRSREVDSAAKASTASTARPERTSGDSGCSRRQPAFIASLAGRRAGGAPDSSALGRAGGAQDGGAGGPSGVPGVSPGLAEPRRRDTATAPGAPFAAFGPATAARRLPP